jgi:anti-anti-sigma factor
MRLHLWAEAGTQQVILHCAGDIIYKREGDLFLGAVNSVRSKRTIIDLQQVRTIDAYGLGKILYAYKQLCRGDEEIIFVNANDHVRELFRLTKLEFCLECNRKKKVQVQDGRKTIPRTLRAWQWSKAS